MLTGMILIDGLGVSNMRSYIVVFIYSDTVKSEGYCLCAGESIGPQYEDALV